MQEEQEKTDTSVDHSLESVVTPGALTKRTFEGPSPGTCSEEAVYLVAYPRCGNTWFRYCFEFLTKRISSHIVTEGWPTGATAPQFLFPSHFWGDPRYCFGQLAPDAPIKHVWLRRDPIEAVMSQVLNTFVGEKEPPSFAKICEVFFNPATQGLLSPGMDGKTPSDRISLWAEKFYSKNLFLKDVPEPILDICRDVPNSSSSERMLLVDYLMSSSSILFAMVANEMTRYHNLMLGHALFGLDKNSAPGRSSLALKFEDFMIEPQKILTEIVDYLIQECKDFLPLSPEEVRTNLSELIENYSYHRNACLGVYRTAGHLASSSTASGTNLNAYQEQLSDRSRFFCRAALRLALHESRDRQLSDRHKEITTQIHNHYLSCYGYQE